MTLNKQETAAVLFALRRLQESFNQDLMLAMKDSDHFYDVDPPSASDIDVLCEKINYGNSVSDELSKTAVVREVILDDDELSITPGGTIAEVLMAGGRMLDGSGMHPTVLFRVEGDDRYWVATVEMNIGLADPEFVKDSLANQEDDDYEHDPTQET